MKRHIAGKTVKGACMTELAEPNIRAIREAAQISQSQFAKLISVNRQPVVVFPVGSLNRFDMKSGAFG